MITRHGILSAANFLDVSDLFSENEQMFARYMIRNARCGVEFSQ